MPWWMPASKPPVSAPGREVLPREHPPILSWDGEDILMHNPDGSFRFRFDQHKRLVAVLYLWTLDKRFLSCQCGHCDWCLVAQFWLARFPGRLVP
jgi:hypothetical protein